MDSGGSTGSTDIPGPPRVSSEKLDKWLRHLSLVWAFNKTTGVGSRVTTPRAERTIECIAKPAIMFGQTLMSTVQVKNDRAGLIVEAITQIPVTTTQLIVKPTET